MIQGSVHIQRKAATVDTAFNHEFFDLLDEKASDDSDDEIPETKNQYFEFSNSYHIMRSIKLILFIQTIAIIVDHPALQFSLFFDICCKAVLSYSLKFYSRPFLDVLYIIQYFWHQILALVESQHLPATPSGVEVTARRLNTNPYGFYNDNSKPTPFVAVSLDPHYWHTMKHFAHYFLGIMFVCMAVLFTIRFWEISDYSNRVEITKWLHRYVSDGWWRRGGVRVAISMAKGCIVLGTCILVISVISRSMSAESFSTGIVVGSIFYIACSVVVVVWVLGYMGIKTTEAAFVRYVSQNVAYTSAIILKRAIKAKVDLGILLMCSLYMPVLYTLLQALLWFTDWNSTHTPSYRQGKNYDVPCYYMAFPPYRQDRLNPDFCTVDEFSSPLQQPRPNGFYLDANILQCDSYLGLTLYIFSTATFVYMILGYFYMFFSMIHLVVKEFKSSKWVDVLEKLIRIRDEEYRDYQDRFPWWNRFYIATRDELIAQLMHVQTAFFWIFETLLKVMKSLVRSVWHPLVALTAPIAFLLERLFIISCLNIATPQTKKRRQSAQSNTGKRSSFFRRLSFLSSTKSGLNTSSPVNADDPKGSASNHIISIDEDYEKSVKNSEKLEFEPWSISEKVSHQMSKLAENVNPVRLFNDFVAAASSSLQRATLRLPFIAYLLVSFNLFVYRFFGRKQEEEGGSLSHGVASLGGSHASWRKELTLPSKTRLLRKLRHHVIAELRMSKVYFISEHELVISFLDYTIDSSGLFTFVILYHYHRLYWFLVVLFELTLYAIFGAVLKQYTSWQARNYVLFGIDAAFGVLTYLGNPYTEERDRWLEFCGRVLVGIVAIGLVIYEKVAKDLITDVFTPIYTPWVNFQFFINLFSGDYSLGLGMVIDLLTVFYFYSYLFYILYEIGFFRVVERMIQAFKFSYHDHVLDFLIDKLDQRSFGMENIFSGLEFVQQWDDIIKLQRRYALLVWPEVRPPNLITMSNKLFEVKWAAFFNLTLRNLRSSLGLTILHTTMFQGDGEVSRWIIHTNPDLLLIQDSQNDSPITVALKECAYYLMVYGEQNDGHLDDHTTFSDEDFAVYYPEVDDVRDEVFQSGEFMEELSIVHLLTADDLIRLKDEGLYIEPKPVDYLKEEKLLKERQAKAKSGYAMRFSAQNSHEEVMMIKAEEELEKAIRLFKRKKKLLESRNQNEKNSLVARRFPEDDIFDNYESGQNSSWLILRYSVPMENIFIDKFFYNRYIKFPNFHYENHFLGRTAITNQINEMLMEKPTSKRMKGTPANPLDLRETQEDFIDLEKNESNRYGESTTDVFDRFIDKDIQYVIPGHKAIHLLDDKVAIRLEEKLNSLALEYPDWDRKLRSSSRRNSSFSLDRRESINASVRSSNQSVHSDNSGILHVLTGRRRKELNDRLANWKICKFAEILMSKEISDACSNFQWDINDFKAFNKLASVNQGKIAQHLALVTRLNVPEGFVRLSDWSIGIMQDVFDERPEADMNLVMKGIVTLVTSIETAAVTVARVSDFVQTAVDVKNLRGRSKRSRSVRRSSFLTSAKSSKSAAGDNAGTSIHTREGNVEGLLSDRVIHYLAETLVCSSPHLILDDCELSYNARRGWRAVARALRRRYCSFILPSVFMPPKPVVILTLILSRNELDCGDCVYIADIFMNQLQLKYVDLSYNRIGARGMNRLCKSLKDHPSIETLQLQHNLMGPGCGRDIGLFVKATKTLRIFNLSNNRLGEMVRFPTFLSREKLVSAAHDICIGLRYNKTLEWLDLSYNHLGTALGDLLPLAVVRHPKLNTLNIAGNDLGAVHGTNLIFQLSGTPLGSKYAKQKEEFIKFIENRQRESLQLQQAIEKVIQTALASTAADEKDSAIINTVNPTSNIYGKESFLPADSNILGVDSYYGTEVDESQTIISHHRNQPVTSLSTSQVMHSKSMTSSSKQTNGKESGERKNRDGEDNEAAIQMLTELMNENLLKLSKPALNLTSLDLSNNQLGPFSGYAVAAAIEHMKGLTHLDVSGNSLGTLGADRITDALELCYDIRPREFIKMVLFDIEEKKYDPNITRNPKKRKKRYTNLLSLNLSRNGIGPKVAGSLMICCKSLKCTLIDLDLSHNPIGASIGESAGNPVESAQLVREGFMKNLSLVKFNINQGSFDPTNLITIFGGLAAHEMIQTICLSDIALDEPCCLQLGNVIQHCNSLKYLNLARCKMGASGGAMICQKIQAFIHHIEYLDLTENYVGPISAIYLAEALKQGKCALKTLRMQSNDLMEAGGLVIAKALIGNTSVTDLDLSNNHFTKEVAFYLSDAARGLFKDGVKIRDSHLKKVLVNDNPMIGFFAAKLMVKSLANNLIEHFEISNIGAGPSTAEVVSRALRDPFIAWKNINLSNNKLTRHGLNQIFWGLRNNKRLRILNVSENQAGTMFCSNADALLSHGISVPVMIRNNVVLKELDLSYNTLVSEAGINIIDAIIDNHTIKKLSLRGNLLDDNIALILPDLFKCNNVLEELDLGYNRLGFACAYAIAESLEFNRSLKKLVLDYNSFGGSGTATLQSFMKSLMMNYSLQILNLDGNKLGPEWGKSFAEIIVRNNTLIQFSLKDNRLDSYAGLALLKAYQHNPYLIELALTSDEIGVDLYEQFKQLFYSKRASIHPNAIEHETSITHSQSALLATYHQY